MPATKRDEQLKRIGLNISLQRKLKGIIQAQLAEMVNISRTHMSNIEAPKVKTALSIDLLLDIANALEIEPALLFQN